jgi:uncharacterized protein (TIGR02996 family)
MSSEQQFLTAIADEPDNLQMRLIYADWLEDQGDERGELIRVVEEMQSIPFYSDRFWELRPRRAQLMQGAAGDWLAALGYNVYRPLFTEMPVEREHRWRLLTEFIETWHGPLEDSPGNTEAEIVAAESRLGVRLPAAMREWYGLFGKAVRYWRLQQEDIAWLGLEDLMIHDEHLWFGSESRFASWGIHLASGDLSDPHVQVLNQSGQVRTIQFSDLAVLKPIEHAMAECYLRGLQEAYYTDVRQYLSDEFDRAKLPGRYDSDETVQVWEGSDALCFNMEHCVFVGVRRESAMAQFPASLRLDRAWVGRTLARPAI